MNPGWKGLLVLFLIACASSVVGTATILGLFVLEWGAGGEGAMALVETCRKRTPTPSNQGVQG